MRCCSHTDCSCYENGYDDGRSDGYADAAGDVSWRDILDQAKADSSFEFTDIRTYPFGNNWVARIDIHYPEGFGTSAAEAIGDLIIQLSKRFNIMGIAP